MDRRVHTALPGRTAARAVLWMAAALLLVTGSLVSLRTAHAAAIFYVTTTVDSSNAALYACPATVAMPCTLRLAIAAANGDPGGDAVGIPAGTYTLTDTAQMQISSAMTIVGADPRNTIIDGGGANRPTSGIFHILSSNNNNPSIDVGISNLTLRHGSSNGSAGALLNESSGTVTLSNDSFENNTTQNSSSSGAAIFNDNPGATQHLVITRSLFVGNEAKATDGLSKGGAIFNETNSVLTITNTTFNANKADSGGAIFNQGTATLVNDTIANNAANLTTNNGGGGGGLVDQAPPTITLTNTIVAGNTNNDCLKFQGSGTFTSGGHNIDSDGTCFLTGTGDKPSTNPRLAALALNAPGQTQTMAIDATSPAYNNAGAAGCPATDQRGVTRPQGPACDIGAYELIVLAPSPSPTPALPKAGEGGSPINPSALVLLGLAALLAPIAIRMALRRRPDDIRAG